MQFCAWEWLLKMTFVHTTLACGVRWIVPVHFLSSPPLSPHAAIRYSITVWWSVREHSASGRFVPRIIKLLQSRQAMYQLHIPLIGNYMDHLNSFVVFLTKQRKQALTHFKQHTHTLSLALYENRCAYFYLAMLYLAFHLKEI